MCTQIDYPKMNINILTTIGKIHLYTIIVE